MDDKKKKFVVPNAETVDFVNEDIITTSVLGFGGTLGEFGTGSEENYEEEA